MESEKKTPLNEAIQNLDEALVRYRAADPKDPLAFLTVAKAFEVAVEYGWRHLKRCVEDEGLDAPSPKAAVREAARLGTISDPKAWIEAISSRNASVHDYFGISEEDFIKISEEFIVLAKKIG